MIKLELSSTHLQTLDTERARLKEQYGLNITRQQLIELLIERHRLSLLTVAQENTESTLSWFWGRGTYEE